MDHNHNNNNNHSKNTKIVRYKIIINDIKHNTFFHRYHDITFINNVNKNTFLNNNNHPIRNGVTFQWINEDQFEKIISLNPLLLLYPLDELDPCKVDEDLTLPNIIVVFLNPYNCFDEIIVHLNRIYLMNFHNYYCYLFEHHCASCLHEFIPQLIYF